MSETWDESKPAGSRSPTLGDDDIKEFKRAIRERLAEDHQFEATENPAFGAAGGYKIGKHNFLTLVQRNTSKVTASDEVAFVCKDVSGSPELLLTPPSAGTDRQLTKNVGANLNIIASDIEDDFISTAMLAALAVNSSILDSGCVTTDKIADDAVTAAKIPAFGLTSDLLNTGVVSTDKIVDAAVTFAKMTDFESAGANNYYESTHKLGGLNRNTQTTSPWGYRIAKIRCVLKGTYRFYWRYRQDYNNVTGYWRVLKNGVLFIGILSDYGTSGSDPWHYRTDDLALVAGDELEWQAYQDAGVGTCETNIWLRGANKSGHIEDLT